MSIQINKPSLVLESSWEVCNKQGGIYTVLSSRAKEMMLQHDGRVIFIGPYFSHEDLPIDFEDQCPNLLSSWKDNERHQIPLPTRVGSWKVPGSPAVVLVDFQKLFKEKDPLYYTIWEHFGVESNEAYGDYDEASLFGIAAAMVMDSLSKDLCPKQEPSIAIFNEWMLGMGLLYAKLKYPHLHSLFITHASTVGRSIAGNNKALYAYMPGYFGDQMASELGVRAKHNIEKAAAHQAELFATVSKITQAECKQLLEREPIVLPNGFEPDFVPTSDSYQEQRGEARKKLFRIAECLTGDSFSSDSLLVSLSGRYEFRNKGIDLFIDAMQQVGNCVDTQRDIIAFILVPAWTSEPRHDLQYLLRSDDKQFSSALQYPHITHWLHNMSEDRILDHINKRGIHNLSTDKLKIIFVPTYLDGKDGIINLSYYQVLMAMDLTIFPSYYEPWGYTPLESIAFGIPTITSNLSGFGLWAREQLAETIGIERAVEVIERSDFNYEEASQAIAKTVIRLSAAQSKKEIEMRKQSAFELSRKANWSKFYTYYLAAYSQLLGNEGS